MRPQPWPERVEALDFFFGTGIYADRDQTVMPQLALLNLKLTKLDGFVVLRKLRVRRGKASWQSV